MEPECSKSWGYSMAEPPEHETKSNEAERELDFTRRTFLGNTGLAGGAMMLAGMASDVARGEDGSYRTAQDERPLDEEGLVHFDIDEARTVQAMTARILPSDEFGPGAVEAGVVYYIDRQMESQWGYASKHYMERPFYDGVPNQGWQSRHTPREAYDLAIEFVDRYANSEYDGDFVDLSPQQQDEVLTAIQEGEIDTFQELDPEMFFAMLRQNTLEGMYCDPMYNGNRNMVGWKLKRFPGSPGALGSYKDLVDREDFIRIPPRTVEDDVESVGVEAASDGDGGDGGQASHHHGARYELESEGDSEEDEDDG